jgi:carbon dioxide concentrating mechanism protein CcmM
MAVKEAAGSLSNKAKIDKTAAIHSLCDLIGDVEIGAHAILGAGSSIRVEEGGRSAVGQDVIIQDGVLVHGRSTGKVLGDDGQEYSIWIGRQATLSHMALVHGPVYLGDECFVGFRSTLFNTRVGNGSIIMMHALVQDVEIPPGKYVASGSIITSQTQADTLPDVQPKDFLLVNQIRELAEKETGIELGETNFSTNTKENQYTNLVNNMGITAELKEQVRSLLNQGYDIGVEHADKRRFKTNSWQSFGTISANRIEQVLQTLDGYLSEYPGEYIRLIGIDKKAKKRAFEAIVQRPDGQSGPTTATVKSNNGSSVSSRASSVASTVDSSVASHVRSLLAQGHKISAEYANARRFKTGSWQSAGVIDSKREGEIIAKFNSILAEHQGEYVRLIGIDSHAKRRVLELIVQRPGENGSTSSGSSNAENRRSSFTSGLGALGADIIQKVRSLLQQGYKIGTEHADKRRFKTGSWVSCSPIESGNESEVLRALNDCLIEHQGEYIRLLGIDTKAKRRVLETVIARPSDGAPASPRTENQSSAPASYSSSYSSNGASSSGSLDSQTLSQVKSLLQQGYKIGTEHADKRRFKTGSWSSCAPVDSTREADVLSFLSKCVAEHQGEYVRLIGIDTKAKRRVLESIIQRP